MRYIAAGQHTALCQLCLVAYAVQQNGSSAEVLASITAAHARLSKTVSAHTNAVCAVAHWLARLLGPKATAPFGDSIAT
jgi:hypothetical protein